MIFAAIRMQMTQKGTVNMEFLYDSYLNAIHVQIAVGTFVMIWGLGVLIWFCKEKKKKLFPAIYAATVFIFLMTLTVKCLVNGGISLLTEKADDAVEKSGIIESICEPSKRQPGFRSGHDHGADVVIDGEVYFVATCEGFEAGAWVTISYLPKSRFVLRIDHDGDAMPPAVSQNTADSSSGVPDGVFWVSVCLLVAGIIRFTMLNQRQRGLRDINRT